MIKNFSCKETEKIWNREFSKKLPVDIQRIGRRKLVLIQAASTLEDLKVPPNNCLEKLTRDREGQYSIRINRQWRVCFCFASGDATEVEIVDYH